MRLRSKDVLEVSLQAIRELRERSGAGVLDCKKALLEAGGDIEGAVEILRKQGLAILEKKASREVREGLIEAYVHQGGRLGALVEVSCETDFVARTREFKELAHDLAMQVAATAPRFVAAEEAPPGEEVNPQDCLLLQPFIKDPQKRVQDIVTETMAKVGERVRVRRFVRFQLGD